MNGTLKEYLRGEGPFQGEDTANGLKAIVEGKLYKQVIGIVGALHHMVHTIQMHRVDLKPDNILVKREQDGRGSYNDILILADFGQARVKRSKQYTKTGMGVEFAGITDAYAPPEAFDSAWRGEKPMMVQEKWDIWPLGCIFVEILTFLSLGQEGVHKLDQEREKKFTRELHLGVDPDMDSDCRFWVTEPSNVSHSGWAPTLKPSIKKWLDHLGNLAFDNKEIDVVAGTKCKEFMAWNIRLTTSMLNPWPSMHISTRCSIDKIVVDMTLELLAAADTNKSLITPMDAATLDRLLGFRMVDVQSAKPEAPATPQPAWRDAQTSPDHNHETPIHAYPSTTAVPRILEPGQALDPQEPWAPEHHPAALRIQDVRTGHGDGSAKSDGSSIDSESSNSTPDIPHYEQRPRYAHAAPGAHGMDDHGESASLYSNEFGLGPGLLGPWAERIDGAPGNTHV